MPEDGYDFDLNPDLDPHPLPEPAGDARDDEINIEVIDDDFGPAPEPPKANLKPSAIQLVRKHRMMQVPDILNLPPIDWFLGGLLPAGPITVIHGKGGARKSFIILDWMLCADQGIQWHGHYVRPGTCLYIAGEGVQGIGKRIRAWAAGHDLDPTVLKTDFMAVPLNLFTLKAEQVDNWASLVEYLHYDYIVVDTLHTAAAGADENSSQDMGLVYNNAVRIAGKASLFFVHHDPKEGKATTARGSSALRDDADVVIKVEQDANLRLTSIIKSDKLRDADEFADVHVHFEVYGDDLASSLYVHSIGHDHDPTALAGRGQRIVNILNDQPGRTKSEIAKLLNSKSVSSTTWDGLVASGEIYAKSGPHNEGGTIRNRELWFTKDYVDPEGDHDAADD